MVLTIGRGVSSSPAREVMARSSMIQAREKSLVSVMSMVSPRESSQDWTIALEYGFPALAEKILQVIPWERNSLSRFTMVSMSSPWVRPLDGGPTRVPSKSNPIQYWFMLVVTFRVSRFLCVPN